MTAPTATPATGRDPLALTLLLGGIALALVVAFALPTLHFRGADKSLMGLSPWEAVPWLTKAKVAFLALAAAAAFTPKLAAIRLPLAVAAAFMMFMPAFAAFAAAVYQWSDVRAEIVQVAGVRAPWIDPGWGLVALLVASLLVLGSVWRHYRIGAVPA